MVANNKKIKRRIIRRVWAVTRILAGLFVFVFFISFLFFLLLTMPSMNNWARNQIIQTLKNQIKTEVTYERIDVNIFTGGDIDGLLIRDHHGDTLIYSKKVHIKLWKNLSSLLGKELSISSVKLDASLLKVKQYPGERDNSLDVFVSHFEKPKKEKRTPVKPFNLDIDQLEFTDFTLFLEMMESGLTERFHIASGNTEIGTLQFPANYFYFRKAMLSKP